MRATRALLTVATSFLLLTSELPAQDAAHDEFLRQAQILEQDLDAYVAARARERDAVREVRDLNAQLTDMLADPNAPVSSLGPAFTFCHWQSQPDGKRGFPRKFHALGLYSTDTPSSAW